MPAHTGGRSNRGNTGSRSTRGNTHDRSDRGNGRQRMNQTRGNTSSQHRQQVQGNPTQHWNGSSRFRINALNALQNALF